MTAITPLEIVHKKGIFGDHKKKNQNELLQISELKGLTIVQVVQYKKSKIELKNIKIDDLEFSKKNSTVATNQKTRILWSAPRTWLIISNKENIINIIEKNCDPSNFATTDVSHSRAAIQIKGLNAREVLKKGCPININEFKKNTCVGTIFNGITVLVDCVEDKPDTFNLFCLRSFGESFYHHITDSALEYGYVSI
tara:strand:- start:981 stop:1568 length:588 start_codon:yes stop_codon:yes gene_type:complete